MKHIFTVASLLAVVSAAPKYDRKEKRHYQAAPQVQAESYNGQAASNPAPQYGAAQAPNYGPAAPKIDPSYWNEPAAAPGYNALTQGYGQAAPAPVGYKVPAQEGYAKPATANYGYGQVEPAGYGQQQPIDYGQQEPTGYVQQQPAGYGQQQPEGYGQLIGGYGGKKNSHEWNGKYNDHYDDHYHHHSYHVPKRVGDACVNGVDGTFCDGNKLMQCSRNIWMSLQCDYGFNCVDKDDNDKHPHCVYGPVSPQPSASEVVSTTAVTETFIA
ncbi:hypothetical protein BC830DRAFT_1165653 [Chytriomyces sp. MP71]|nr:hypothetical protein BC830DRAFT_1165653 [Chytriomyces sp. MP71]